MNTNHKLLSSPAFIATVTILCLLVVTVFQVYISEVVDSSCMHSACTTPSDFAHYPLWLYTAPVATSLIGAALFIISIKDKLTGLSITLKSLLVLMIGTWLFVIQWCFAFGLYLFTSHVSIR